MAGERFYIKSLKTGRTYLVEAIGMHRTNFGDSLDNHCNGSIRERDSWIKNGIYSSNPGDAVEYLDSLPNKGGNNENH